MSITDFDETVNHERPYTRAWYERMRERFGAAACQQLGFYAFPADFVLSVVIPVYNEEKTLEELVERVRSVPVTKEIVLVDDCSGDGSREVMERIRERMEAEARQQDQARENSFGTNSDGEAFDDLIPPDRIRVLHHEKNRGKGAAVRTGFEHASGDVVVVQDADLEYDPAEFPRLLQPIIEGKADVVFGSRFLGDQPHRVLYYWHYLGNKFLTTLSNSFTNLNLTDMETCYKLFTRDAIRDVLPTLKQNRFGFEPEVTAKIARRRYRVYEMSVSYSGRTYEQGKKIGWKDGLQALWCIVRYGLKD